MVIIITRGQFMANIIAKVKNNLCDCYCRIVLVKLREDNILGRAIATKVGLIKFFTIK